MGSAVNMTLKYILSTHSFNYNRYEGQGLQSFGMYPKVLNMHISFIQCMWNVNRFTEYQNKYHVYAIYGFVIKVCLTFKIWSFGSYYILYIE